MGYMKSAYISSDAAFELRLLELLLPFGGYNVIRRNGLFGMIGSRHATDVKI